MKTYTGTVKFFSSLKGYGIIDNTTPDVGEDVFVHYSAIADQEGYRNLVTGERVAFTLAANGGKGFKAIDVRSLHAELTQSEAYERQGGR